jgi:hypothetical protein
VVQKPLLAVNTATRASAPRALVVQAWAQPVEVGLVQVLQKAMRVLRELQVLREPLGLHWVQALSSRCHRNILLVYPLMSRQSYKIYHIGYN